MDNFKPEHYLIGMDPPRNFWDLPDWPLAAEQGCFSRKEYFYRLGQRDAVQGTCSFHTFYQGFPTEQAWLAGKADGIIWRNF